MYMITTNGSLKKDKTIGSDYHSPRHKRTKRVIVLDPMDIAKIAMAMLMGKL